MITKNSILPLVPVHILKAHKVNEPNDSRFKAAARLLQALWRERQGLTIGLHYPPKGESRKLGSRIESESAKKGANFLTQDIAKLAFRESVYREIGAVIEQERLWTNMLSSQPLCFNLFGALKLDIDKANRFFQHLLSDYVASVEDIYFEHSPGRGDSAFTEDGTAFDAFVTCTTLQGQHGFVAIEVKYSESMAGPLATLRPRYDDLSMAVGVYREPESRALRANPLQQIWREHLLSRSMIINKLYESGRFVLIYPKQNYHCESAAKLYQRELISSEPAISGFQPVIMEACLAAYRAIGEDEMAQALHERYLDFGKIEEVIFG